MKNVRASSIDGRRTHAPTTFRPPLVPPRLRNIDRRRRRPAILPNAQHHAARSLIFAFPDPATTAEITPKEAGTFPAICDHYCGMGHGNMKMTFVVE